jgi:hypothetical protein
MRLFGEPHFSHAALADELEEAIRPDRAEGPV